MLYLTKTSRYPAKHISCNIIICTQNARTWFECIWLRSTRINNFLLRYRNFVSLNYQNQSSTARILWCPPYIRFDVRADYYCVLSCLKMVLRVWQFTLAAVWAARKNRKKCCAWVWSQCHATLLPPQYSYMQTICTLFLPNRGPHKTTRI